MTIKTSPEFERKFQEYPLLVREQMLFLRKLIEETAFELEGLNELDETIKWGEPSFIAKKGSTLRIDYKSKRPNQYAMYFKCTSKLIPTIKQCFGELFKYEKNRAILFSLEEKVPHSELKTCIRLALQYHKLKHLPLLGEMESQMK